jgi:2,4-dienoyl-CoA reductase-like NADH-dependent reductase (Old Yellow Enzyme family)
VIFKKLKINNIFLNNRVAVGPMCQYSAINGRPSSWHFSHLQKLSQLGAGMLILESTFPSKNATISKNDLILSNNLEKKSFKNLTKHIRKFSNIPLGIQISHAGRKGSSHIPWKKFNSSLNKKEGAWTTYAPSSIKRDKSWPIPVKLDVKKIYKIRKDFVNSAQLAKQSGFDLLEVHMAHGYLLHQFFSPISNKRTDEYGGNLVKRSRFLLEIAEDIRQFWPKEKILGARVTADDCLKNGITMDDCTYLVNELKNIGFDYVTPSSGGIIPITNKKIKPCYQVKYCYQLKKSIDIKVYANGMIRTKKEINNMISNNYADFVAVSKPFINNPYWLFKIAKNNGINLEIAKQYSKCFQP